MVLPDIFERFAQRSPLSVMAQVSYAAGHAQVSVDGVGAADARIGVVADRRRPRPFCRALRAPEKRQEKSEKYQIGRSTDRPLQEQAKRHPEAGVNRPRCAHRSGIRTCG